MSITGIRPSDLTSSEDEDEEDDHSEEDHSNVSSKNNSTHDDLEASVVSFFILN